MCFGYVDVVCYLRMKMVKLFVGNLAETVDNTKLLQAFAQHCKVTECDVLKNYAFVHIEDEGNVDDVIKRLDGYTLEGRSIHIERSTSRLRKQPGMGDKCFRCGATEHKTVNCPHDEKNSTKNGGAASIKIDLTNNVNKRSYGGSDEPLAKRSTTHGYYASQLGGVAGSLQQSHSLPQPQPLMTTPTAAPLSLSAGAMPLEQEIPRPHDADLQPLYEQYAETRQRFLYYRERLVKEMQARQLGGGMASAGGLGGAPMGSLSMAPVPSAPSYMVAAPLNGSSTQLTAPAVSYLQPQQPTAWNGIAVSAPVQGAPLASSVAVAAASHPYSSALKAPYASGQMTQMTATATPSAPYAIQQQMSMQQQPLMTAQQPSSATMQFQMGTASQAAPYHSSMAGHHTQLTYSTGQVVSSLAAPMQAVASASAVSTRSFPWS